MTIRRRGTLAMYQQIAADLRAQIVAGELPVDAQLPTEHELSEQYGVSRQTVREGLRLLVTEGLVVPRRPAGHFVRRREEMIYRPQQEFRPQPVTVEMDRFYQQVQSEGRVPSQTIEVAIVQASESVASHLQIEPGSDVVLRRRTRRINGDPLNINDSYYPLDIVRESEIMSPADIPRGTNQVLADLGYQQERVIDEHHIRMSTPDEDQRLALGRSTPVDMHLCTGYTQDGRPVRHTVNVLPGDRHVVVYERTRTPATGPVAS